jgi:phasin
MATGPSLEVPQDVRKYADESVDKAKQAFNEFMKAVHKAAETADSTQGDLSAGARDMNKKMLAITEQNVSAAFDLAQKVVHAKDPSEIMQLQMAYVQQCAAAIGDQSREFQEQLMKTMSMFGQPPKS